jgi:hypothetical protein
MIPAFTACLYEQFVTAQEDRMKAEGCCSGLEWFDSCLASCFIAFSLQPKHLSSYLNKPNKLNGLDKPMYPTSCRLQLKNIPLVVFFLYISPRPCYYQRIDQTANPFGRMKRHFIFLHSAEFLREHTQPSRIQIGMGRLSINFGRYHDGGNPTQ